MPLELELIHMGFSSAEILRGLKPPFGFGSRAFRETGPLLISNGDAEGKNNKRVPDGSRDDHSQDGMPNRGISPEQERESLTNRWRDLPPTFTKYNGGTWPDGTRFEPGDRLEIDGQQVMDSFERPWAEKTVWELFEELNKRRPVIVAERGYGLGITFELGIREMYRLGGEYHVFELNRGVYELALKKTTELQRFIKKNNYPVQLFLHFGDADQLLKKFPDNYFDGMISDTHQLKEDQRGINDLIGLSEIVRVLKPNGVFTFCAFHRDNQTGNLDPRQISLISKYFHEYRVTKAETFPPPDCSYAQGPTISLPVPICNSPVKTTA